MPDTTLNVGQCEPSFNMALNFPMPIPASIAMGDHNSPYFAYHHRQEFCASGISDDLIDSSGIRSVSGDEVARMLNWTKRQRIAGTGWAIPFDNPTSPDCYWRVKLDQPRVQEGRTIKYESPKGSSNRLYRPPGFDDAKGAAIVITEGEKKALSAIGHDINCLGLTGVWNWQKPRKRNDEGRGYGSRHLIDDVAAIGWKDRDVIICFDSDAVEKHSVELAQQRLAEALAKRGAKIKIARLPSGESGRKLGLDDAIMELGIETVRNILDSAEAPELPKLTNPVLAHMLLDDRFSAGELHTLVYWRDTFWKWNGQHYEETSADAVQNEAYRYMEQIGKEPSRSQASEVLAALKAEVEVDSRIGPPHSLHGLWEGSGRTGLAFNNRVLFVDFDTEPPFFVYHVADPSPDWFCTGSRSYAFDPKADCLVWRNFLMDSLGDEESIDLLQQWFGYLLSGRLAWHKLLVLHGALRAGKSIIASMMAEVVGLAATATSSLKALGENFGLWPLMGKQLLLIPDAQDRGACIGAVERIKAITGCDGLTVDRKYLPALNNVHLQTRIVITCNSLPRFLDASGALHRRMMLVNFKTSFAGREDLTLPGRIKKELPGIFNWALQGWDELRNYGVFTQPTASREILAEAEHVLSPIKAFLDECCEIDDIAQVPTDDLWNAWQPWCKKTGHQPGNRAKLGTDLRGCLPTVERHQARCQGPRVYSYRGLKLNVDGRKLCDDWQRTEYKRLN